MQYSDGRNKRKKKVEQRYCIQCGKKIIRNTKAGTSRIRVAQYRKSKFCNKTCKGLWQVKNFVGKNSYNWKGGISTENEKIRGSKKYKKWRISVFQRDNFTCKKCNKTGGDMNAHHIEGFNKNKDLIYIIDNGVTLCTNCHRKFHKKYGSGDNSLEQFLSFIK